MADAQTSEFKFVLPEIGGADATWGYSLNANLSQLDSLLSQAFDGEFLDIGRVRNSVLPTNPAVGTTTVNGDTVVGETAGVHLRMKPSAGATGIAALLRTDATSLYLMLTASGDANGTFNSLRPFTVNKSTGLVTMNNGLSLPGNSGLSTGTSVAAGGALDLSRHINLYGGSYGLSVAGGGLNLVSGGSSTNFYIGSSLTATVNSDGQLLAGVGVARPGHSFLGAVDMGLSRWTASAMALVVGGEVRAWVNSTQFVIPTGVSFNAVDGVQTGDGPLLLPTGGGIRWGSGTTRLVATAGNAQLSFVIADTTVARVEPAGTSMPIGASVATREKGDVRWVQVSSSLRYKEKISIASRVANLFDLENYRFVWGCELPKDDPRRGRSGYGFIAEQVEQIIPEAVIYNEKGEVEGINPLPLISALMEEVRHLKNLVEKGSN